MIKVIYAFKFLLKKFFSIKIIGKYSQILLYPFSRAYEVIYRLNNLNIINDYPDYKKSFNFSEEYKNIEVLLSKSLVVRNGIFQGMKYDLGESVGSSFLPKILGSYEKELEKILLKISQKNYNLIVDIGCAEGYYAIGFARLFKYKDTQIEAFDTDEKAQLLCRKNAKKNDVNIKVNDFCDSHRLLNLCKNKYALIFIDAEGYEIELINEKLVRSLKSCDFLIEAHDFINIKTSEYLSNCFKKTHKIQIIKSVDDISKAYEYNFPEIDNLSLKTKFQVLREDRPTIMRWIYAEKI